MRRYAPQFLDILKLRAASVAKCILDAIKVLRDRNSDKARKAGCKAWRCVAALMPN